MLVGYMGVSKAVCEVWRCGACGVCRSAGAGQGSGSDVAGAGGAGGEH